jgi:hypothetical protein
MGFVILGSIKLLLWKFDKSKGDAVPLLFEDGPPLTSNGASYSDRRYVSVPPKLTSCQTIVPGEVKVTRNEPPGGLAFSS